MTTTPAHALARGGVAESVLEDGGIGQPPAASAETEDTPGAYRRMTAARELMERHAERAAAEFAELLGVLYPQAAYITLKVYDDDSVALKLALTADGRTIRRFDDLTRGLPPLPADLAARWWPHDLSCEIPLDHIAEELREAGVSYEDLPAEARDPQWNNPDGYIPCLRPGGGS